MLRNPTPPARPVPLLDLSDLVGGFWKGSVGNYRNAFGWAVQECVCMGKIAIRLDCKYVTYFDEYDLNFF
jgi:hypothetical protein